MREINPKDTTRAYAFEMWMQAPNPMVTFFKKDGTITTRNATTTPNYAGQFVNGNGYFAIIINELK